MLRRRRIGAVGVALVIAALVCGAIAVAAEPSGRTAAGAVPAGPRLAVLVGGAHPGHGTEVRTVGPAGEAQQQIASGLRAVAGLQTPAWSPGGSKLALYAPREGKPPVYLMDADGSNLFRPAISAHPAGEQSFFESEPVFDPAGDLAVDIYKVNVHFENGVAQESVRTRELKRSPPRGSAVWALPIDGSRPRALTGFWANRVLVPHSFTPDGTLVGTLYGPRGYSVGVFDPGDRSLRSITPSTPEGDPDPAVSPDGSQVAYLRDQIRPPRNHGDPVLESTELMVVPISGGKPRLLARVSGGAFWPSWDPSGSRVVFTALNVDPSIGSNGALGRDNSLMEVNPDGSCLTKVYSAGPRHTVYGASWQPGDDRGAGPISC